ncbi:MAG: redoxin domain-containing protein, partial [Bacteroidales bacterium]|nr:redoxin domain-containing protein [Bacteroidales bacterium]
MLQIGTKAPYFEGVDENGSTVRLSDFAGKKLVLYFDPKDTGDVGPYLLVENRHGSLLVEGPTVGCLLRRVHRDMGN